MFRKKYQPLSPEALSKAGAVLGFLWWLAGLLWHGIFSMPSMMGMRFDMPYLNPIVQLDIIVVLVAGGFVSGWLLASVYNWFLKK